MDEFEEFEQLNYGDDFEDKFADELDALHDLDNDDCESPIQRAKRRLNFVSESENCDKSVVTESVELGPACKRPKTGDDVFSHASKEQSAGFEFPSTQKTSPINEVLVDVQTNQETKSDSVVKPSVCKFTKKQSFPRPPSNERISFTTFDGNLYHLNLRDESYFSDQHIELTKTRAISQTYAELLDEANKIIESRSISKLIFENKENIQSVQNNNLLWVEKFKPKDFLELLSDDGINRALLSWLKLWDKVVFKREAPKKPKKETVVPQGKPKFQEVIKELDELGRPQQKLALLCGPPGLGKTTLAYIISKQAGYNVVEMNASDDRSPDVFKRQLEAATQMRAVLGQEPKPNCLVIDEVDGAAAPAINALVAFTKESKKHVLLRPIICICNDLYTPALRPLRQMSFVLTFPPTCSARLVCRLLEISRTQEVKTDRSALIALCEKAENDIRSCLSTIQFLHTLKGELRLKDVRSVSVGQKDTQASMFSVWQQILQLPRSQKKADFQSRVQENSPNSKGRLAYLLKLILSCGEYEKLLQGLFENYLNINYRDPELNRTSLGADWMCYASEIQHVISHLQVYSIMPYIPYVVVAFHYLFAIIGNVTISYPSSQFEFKTNLSKRENIVTTMLQDMSPIARSSLSSNEIVLSFLPNLFQIVQPSLRPVNTQLYSSREKMDLQHVVDTMVTYNLNYRQERNAEGLYNYVLEPDINEVISFEGLKASNNLSYSAKQLIARELELERMRRSESKVSEIVVKKGATAAPTVPVPNHQQVLKPKAIADEPAEATDFFGRKITKVVKKETSSSGLGNVWFKFKEGYTNAARKTIYMKDLL